MAPSPIEIAVEQLMATIPPDAWSELGGRLTCDEAEAFADFLVVAGRATTGKRLMEEHAMEDDDPDRHRHYGGDISDWKNKALPPV